MAIQASICGGEAYSFRGSVLKLGAWLRGGLVALVATTSFTGNTKQSLAQSELDQSQIRELVGTINIEQITVFTANRATYEKVCQKPYKFDGIASIIGRLQYGAMTPDEKVTFKRMLDRQVKANVAMFEVAADKRAAKDYCLGADMYLNKYLTDFMDAHPDLFKERSGR